MDRIPTARGHCEFVYHSLMFPERQSPGWGWEGTRPIVASFHFLTAERGLRRVFGRQIAAHHEVGRTPLVRCHQRFVLLAVHLPLPAVTRRLAWMLRPASGTPTSPLTLTAPTVQFVVHHLDPTRPENQRLDATWMKLRPGPEAHYAWRRIIIIINPNGCHGQQAQQVPTQDVEGKQ